ncbi:MAG TPA: hypothetical protein VH497_10050 [Vicinamibacterales bacterium]|jgi:hypothetical protein
MSLTRVAVFVVLLGFLAAASPARAQESKSGPLAKQLAAALDAAKLDSVAAKDPSAADTFIAALYFPGAQLLVVSAKYTAPQLLDARLSKKEYRDTYIDLSSASVPDSKVFVQDALADGLKAKRDENQPFDIIEIAGKPVNFDGDWKKQKISEQDYMKAFGSADDRYSNMLHALIAELKKTS